MRYRQLLVVASLMLGIPAVHAAEKESLPAVLAREIVSPRLNLIETQQYTESRLPRLPEFKSQVEWNRYAQQLRTSILDEIVFRGKAAEWRTAKTKVEWGDTITGGPGYRIKKLRYEALPGVWIPALLYEPEKLTGKVPVILNVNGHDAPGKAAVYKQIRCINQAKRGMLALNLEWLYMGQLRIDNWRHGRMNQIDLCGASGLAPFYLAMQRGLDVLLALEHADAERVAVTGLSGGGWQTIMLSALDTRVKLANPVAGYGSTRNAIRYLDVGDSEQVPNDFLRLADYTHLTALMAPRPLLLTYNAKDDCCWLAAHTLPPLLEAAAPVYRLHGNERFLRTHVNYVPGTHNYEKDNREAFYRMLNDHFYTDKREEDARELPCEGEVKTKEDLNVPLPADNGDFHSLALALSKDLPRNPKLPDNLADARKWQQAKRGQLRDIVRARDFTAKATQVGADSSGTVRAACWWLNMDNTWTVPAVELVSDSREKAPKATAILVADEGHRFAVADTGRLLAQGCRVVAVDPFGIGEAKIDKHAAEFALLMSAVGDRPLGLQASQVAAVARWLKAAHADEQLTVVARGPRASTVALVAAALEGNAINGLELHGALGSLKEVIDRNQRVEDMPEMFCFGLLEAFDVKQLAALVAPRPVVFADASARAKKELAGLKAWYALLGSEFEPVGLRTNLRVVGIVLKWVRADKETNFKRIEPMIREAAKNGADLVCTTECFLDGYAIADKSIPVEDYRKLGEPIPSGPYCKRLATLALELKIHLIAGMAEADGEARYNTAILIGPDGKLIGKYRKQKLGHETDRNTAGDKSNVFDTPFGRVGIMICADRTDQAIVRRYRENGATLLICPSGGMFGPKKNDPIVQERSKENRLPMVFVHPAEFLVTGPDGAFLERQLLGDRLFIAKEQAGAAQDQNRVYYFDLPLGPKRARDP